MSKRVQAKKSRSKQWQEVYGVFLVTAGVLLLLSVLSYHPDDVALFRNQTTSYNWVGPFGVLISSLLILYIGITGYLIPFLLMWMGGIAILYGEQSIKKKWLGLAVLSLTALVDLQTQFWFGAVKALNIGSPGGHIGELLSQRTIGYWIGETGATVFFGALFFLSVIRMLNIEVIDVAKKGVALWQDREAVFSRLKLVFSKPQRQTATSGTTVKVEVGEPVEELLPQVDIEAMVAEQQKEDHALPVEPAEPVKKRAPKPKKEKKSDAAQPKAEEDFEVQEVTLSDTQLSYTLPSMDLLDPAVVQGKGMSPAQVADTAKILQDALEEFGVEAKVTGVQQGPVVTCYEILPSAGVRVERIKSLSDNIALKMHAESIRIQAPIPGKGVCGVEVPNAARAGVFFRDLVASQEFKSEQNALPLVLGKDVSGQSMIFDLAKMPHMLIAGATGAGKSVCMNTILTGLLMKYSPEDLRLILVDPKTVEFHTYNNLPHLVVPVITEAKKVSLGLRWAIDEMERRFRYFKQAGVRDLPGYNKRPITKQEDLFNEKAAAEAEEKGEEVIPDRLPYIVIVIDELADLMAVAQAEIEAGIARLAAKSRAAGIHMILATQRPDVKVITGTIKANFPARVAFKVSQKVDSRTILDRMGADTLLGKGDMLVLPPGSDKLIRSQGAFTSDGEIERVTTFWKEQSQPEFIVEIKEKMDKPAADLPEMDSGADEEVVEQALEVIRQTKRASTSSLQRRLRIGYTRAARVMDLLEERGIIGPPDGAGPREILIDLDGEIPSHPGEHNETDTP
jgi:S-DNA-T family DNA segregation ATPase FtsK/SpoIIIE